MKISIYIDTDNKDDVEKLTKINQVLAKRPIKKAELESVIRKIASEVCTERLSDVRFNSK